MFLILCTCSRRATANVAANAFVNAKANISADCPGGCASAASDSANGNADPCVGTRANASANVNADPCAGTCAANASANASPNGSAQPHNRTTTATPDAPELVWATVSSAGKRWHRAPTCFALRSSKLRCLSLECAIGEGLTKCAMCRSATQENNKAQGQKQDGEDSEQERDSEQEH